MVYGPQGDRLKMQFLEELRSVRQSCSGMWMICGDFNIIYKAEDKSNGSLHRRMMGRFRRLIDDLKLQELYLKGRRFTWSNERDSPTLERLDRFLVSDDWLEAFPNHDLSALSTECSDHAPLLLRTDCAIPHFKRFRFENIWPRYPGYMEVVAEAWNAPLPCTDLDPFRILDIKLRATAKALKSWSAKHVGNVQLQLAIAKELVLRFDFAQEHRALAPYELALRHKAKLNCLGLVSLQRTIVRQRSHITYLAEGDANTKFFHLQACHRSRKNYIESVRVGDARLVREEEKAEAFFKHFDDLLGTECTRTALDFNFLGLPTIDTSLLDVCFTEEEVWRTILEIPIDRAPGPDGFSGLFYRTAWSIIKPDIMRAFHALWSLDGRSLYLINQAYIVLLRKKGDASEISDYRPISLIHSFTKVLATRLAPLMQQLVKPNQSAFIRERMIHENFIAVQLSAKLLHRNKRPCALMKVDIAKAFDTVSWSFLFLLLEHMGFSRRWINWISLLLSTASTRIILNGMPGRRICHARGLRQGDPLSPLLFVMAMEALNAMFRAADNLGLLEVWTARSKSVLSSMLMMWSSSWRPSSRTWCSLG